ncbi:MAG: Stp1/IreP family PP2C-type Ser/Thr phosphatase [Clostridiales bacterium]|uniref:Stp1/IreP family PP2C-type Ser/Thr phosphatase n=1 Tax=Clostridium sp. N3C TaxID=1776758 RepID=UPI00092E0D0A|nr:Stp1/IreP family PP2C-type Ser/Thr phosphatase [Clostridium sp. N3C]NLZ49814.1 Stp1/IreP family PP2C-type Ser/Thr phosphatase [Clostridiales bacterium]SCN22017.1 Serine/threonine phosphatase stp [Clostridium sp. N3C]
MLGALTDVGNVRQINEDYFSYSIIDNIKIYIVADGMGGHNAGEIASKLAVESVIQYIKEHKDTEDLKALLKDAIVYANSVIYNQAKENSSLKGMGTTITAYFKKCNYSLVANVGDSSCYIIKEDKISKITKDHSLVQQLVDEGTITEQEAKHHPNKNIITRAIGTSPNVDVDIFVLDPIGISKIILCSDGLTNEVQPEEIYQYIKGNSNNMEVCRDLVNLAKERGGKDNITLMVIEGECNDDRNHIE